MHPVRVKILVAEDDPISAKVLSRTLREAGFAVDHVSNGRDALTQFQKQDYRIVISDWMMPNMTGVELCREIRSLHRPYVYVILLTSRGDRSDRTEAFEAGVDDMLAKPLDREELHARLKVADRILKSEERLQSQKSEIELARENLLIANQNLSIASRRFEDLFHRLPVACFTFDQQGLIHEWNRNAEVMFGVPAHVSYQQPIWKVLEAQDSDLWTEQSVREALSGKSVESQEWTYQDSQGEERYLVCNMFPLLGPANDILGAISANIDITDRRHAERRIEDQKRQLEFANERLERLALTDGLTGLRNHRAFYEELDRVLSKSSASGSPVSLAMVDVDHFKIYNDTYGHPAGDEVLKKLAALLAETCPTGHFAARYGGEEFAVVMPDSDVESSSLAAEVIRQRVASANWPMSAVTISLGVATSNAGDKCLEELVLNADRALYASKHEGRNRVTHANKVGDGPIHDRRKAA